MREASRQQSQTSADPLQHCGSHVSHAPNSQLRLRRIRMHARPGIVYWSSATPSIWHPTGAFLPQIRS